MPRPQFSIRTLLLLTLVVAVGLAAGPPLARNYAPKWGQPTIRVIDEKTVERKWPTGRIERVNHLVVWDEIADCGIAESPKTRNI